MQDLEKEIVKCIREDHRIECKRKDLKQQAERLQRLASQKVIADPPKYEVEDLLPIFLTKLLLSHNANVASGCLQHVKISQVLCMI